MSRTYRNTVRWEPLSIEYVHNEGHINPYTGKLNEWYSWTYKRVQDGKSRDNVKRSRNSLKRDDKKYCNKMFRAKVREAMHHSKSLPHYRKSIIGWWW